MLKSLVSDISPSGTEPEILDLHRPSYLWLGVNAPTAEEPSWLLVELLCVDWIFGIRLFSIPDF